jgi:hypothetical protein
MEVLYPHCAGLDVHKVALSDWLAGAGCTHIAMEATGIYWKCTLGGAMAIATGPGKPVMIAVTESVAVAITETVLSPEFATKSLLPSGVIAKDPALLPGMLPITVPVAVLTTDTVLSPEFAT